MRLQAALSALEAMQELWGPERTLPSAHELLQRETTQLVLGKLTEARAEAKALRHELAQLREAHAAARDVVAKQLQPLLLALAAEPGGAARHAALAKLLGEP